MARIKKKSNKAGAGVVTKSTPKRWTPGKKRGLVPLQEDRFTISTEGKKVVVTESPIKFESQVTLLPKTKSKAKEFYELFGDALAALDAIDSNLRRQTKVDIKKKIKKIRRLLVSLSRCHVDRPRIDGDMRMSLMRHADNVSDYIHLAYDKNYTFYEPKNMSEEDLKLNALSAISGLRKAIIAGSPEPEPEPNK